MIIVRIQGIDEDIEGVFDDKATMAQEIFKFYPEGATLLLTEIQEMNKLYTIKNRIKNE